MPAHYVTSPDDGLSKTKGGYVGGFTTYLACFDPAGIVSCLSQCLKIERVVLQYKNAGVSQDQYIVLKMPERVEAVEFVKVTGMEDNKACHIEDREKLYYQRRSMPVIISPPDSSTTVERSGIPEDSKITIVQGQDSLYPQGQDSLYPGGKSRCSLWMLWLKFSSFLYLVLILLLILWALHQYKEAQEKDTPLYQVRESYTWYHAPVPVEFTSIVNKSVLFHLHYFNRNSECNDGSAIR